MVSIRNIHKQFDEEVVLQGINLDVREGECLSLLGPSGCGKSTLLKILAGMESPDKGEFEIEGRDIFQLQPAARKVVYLSQEPLLFPHLSVKENLAYGLRIRKESPSTVDQRVVQMAESLDIGPQLNKLPHQLSGGQKQRVNFGRALIINPQVLLLDEPFGHLDTGTRQQMQELYSAIRNSYSITSLFVTHDLREAIAMGDRIARLDAGQLKVYPDLKAFIHDPQSGVKKEIDFWNELNSDT
jgi:ABC-type sugar transport system ATPase subunit